MSKRVDTEPVEFGAEPHARFLAIDPGNVASAWALVDIDGRPLEVEKSDNATTRHRLAALAPECTAIAVENVESFGMAVGATVFATVRAIGRYEQICEDNKWPLELIPRGDIKMHHCRSRKANDSNITTALVDRFAYGLPNKGKGTKAKPGWFYGFSKDIWQAYALAIVLVDRATGRQ